MYVVRIDSPESAEPAFEAFAHLSLAEQSLNLASVNIARGQAVRAFMYEALGASHSEAAIETVRGGGGRLIRSVSGLSQV
jgi:hypothetical protein